MLMWMMRQRRAPSVQHQRRADLRAQMLGIGGDGAQSFGRDIKQQAIDHGLVVIRDFTDRRRQGEYDMVIRDREEFTLPFFEPAARGTGLALRTMPVAARVIRYIGVFAVLAGKHMSTQCRAAALLDG
jgi:hypothetical protein